MTVREKMPNAAHLVAFRHYSAQRKSASTPYSICVIFLDVYITFSVIPVVICARRRVFLVIAHLSLREPDGAEARVRIFLANLREWVTAIVARTTSGSVKVT